MDELLRSASEDESGEALKSSEIVKEVRRLNEAIKDCRRVTRELMEDNLGLPELSTAGKRGRDEGEAIAGPTATAETEQPFSSLRRRLH